MYLTTLAEVIDEIAPQADGRLVDRGCLSRIRSIAERLPSKVSDFMGFERVLGFDDPEVDYAFGLSDHGADWMMSLGPWPTVRRSLSKIYPYIGSTAPRPWLEFDTRRSDATIAEPSLYVALDPLSKASVSGPTISIAQALGWNRSVPVERILACIEAIPASATRLYLGAMYSRCSTGVRISIGGIGPAELLGYIKDVSWPGDRNAIEATLDTVATPGRRFGVQIDVATDIDAWLGIELMLNEPYPSANANTGDLKLLDDLCAAKRCTRKEQDSLLRWPTRIEFTAPFIDRYIDARSATPGRRLRHGALTTALHHYKLAFKRDGSIETKAYFGVYIGLR